jgi:ATP synthase protein I
VNKTRQHPAGKQAFALIRVQVLTVLVVAALTAIYTGDMRLMYSIILGGAICVIPNLLFAWRFFAHSGSQAIQQVARAFYLGEMGKFVLTIAMLFASMALLDVSIPALLLAFILTQQIFWLAPLFFKPVIRSKAA